jgi:hypothetical protein
MRSFRQIDQLQLLVEILPRRTGADIGSPIPLAAASPESVSQEVKLLLWYLTQVGHVVVHRQCRHHSAHRVHGILCPAFAADDEVVRIIDDLRRPATRIPQRLPSEDEAPHVQIRQQR